MVSSSNNPVNNKVGASISGVTNTFTVTNPSNTASSAARETITVGGASAADPTLNWNISGVTNWEMGIDNSVSDNLTISQGTALGTNDVWRMDTSGRRTMPLQPCFSVILNTTVNSVTGDSTNYLVLFDTILTDQGSNVTLSSGAPTRTIFTAPVTGNYQINTGIRFTNIGAQNSYVVAPVVNGGGVIAYNAPAGNMGVMKDPSTNNFGTTNCSVINLTAGDTVSIVITARGGAKTVGVLGAPFYNSYFNGYLV